MTAAGALLLTSCSAGGGDSAADSGDGAAFSFTFATSTATESPFATLAEEYMEDHPDVDITLNPQPNDQYAQTLRTQLQADNASDLIQTGAGSGQPHSVAPLAEAGFLEPLGETSASLIPSGSDALFMSDGETYGQPVDFSVVGVVANTTALKEKEIEDFPATTDEMLSACGDLGDDSSLFAVAGSVGQNTGLMAMSVAASQVYADTPDWNERRADGETTFAESEGWRNTLELIVQMDDAGCFQNGVAGGGFDQVTEGLSSGSSIGAFIPSGAATEIESSSEGQELGIQAFPAPSPDDRYVLASSNYALSVNASADEEVKEAAQAFLDWAAEPDQVARTAEIGGYLPVTGLQDYDFEGSGYEDVADLVREDQHTVMPNTVWPEPAVYDELGSGVQGLLTGQSDIDDVLAAMDEAWS